jgi:hypothetical protein
MDVQGSPVRSNGGEDERRRQVAGKLESSRGETRLVAPCKVTSR